MNIRFWGVRGSIPTPLTSDEVAGKIRAALAGARDVDLRDEEAIDAYVASLPLQQRGTIGGNTSCVTVTTSGGDLLILDCGSGLRSLGYALLQGPFGQGKGEAAILMSHTHWDHMQGFPFFVPAYIPGNRFRVLSPFADMEERFRDQQERRFFPVSIDDLAASLEFEQTPEEFELADGRVHVQAIALDHPGVAYGYRIKADDKVLVYASDAEYKRLDSECMLHFASLFIDADVLIFDAMYTLMESFEKSDWGHSSSVVGIELATAAKAKRLVLFHHDPTYDDAKLMEIFQRTLEYQNFVPAEHRCEVLVGYEGLEIAL